MVKLIQLLLEKKLKLKKLKMKTKKVFLFLLIILFASCSTRKVAKTEIKETTKVSVIDTSKEVSTKNENINIVENSEKEVFTITPIDTTKKMVVNGKSYFNAILKHEKNKAKKEYKKDIKVSNIKQKAVILANETNKQVFQKQIERKSFNFWWLLLLLIPLIWIYRKKIITFVLS